MEILKRLADLEEKMKQLTGPSVKTEAEDDADEDEVQGAPAVQPVDIDGKLTPEILSRIYEGVLEKLAELEEEGIVPELDTPAKARDALLAAVRQMYIKKSLISKMGRVLARVGAKRYLRKQRNVIGKVLSK